MDISVIIPFYNEADNVNPVLDEVAEVLRSLRAKFEIIAVDDGSTDGTPGTLKQRRSDIMELNVLCHECNRGQGAAFWTGFGSARGNLIITLDGDGQNDFRDVPMMLGLLKDHDAVIGQRLKRRDPWSKRFATAFAYHMRQLFLKDGIRDTSCSLKILKRPALAALIPVRSFFLFMPFLLQQAGSSYVTVEVNHRPRQKGKTKYKLRSLFFFAVLGDLLFMWWYKKNCILKNSNEENLS